MACLLVAVPTFGQTGTSSTSGTFQTNNQSIWASGPLFTYNYANNSLSTSFNVNPGISVGDCSIGCAFAGLNLSGSLGLNIGASLDSGSVSAAVPFNASDDLPTLVKAGSSFTPTSLIGLGTAVSYQYRTDCGCVDGFDRTDSMRVHTSGGGPFFTGCGSTSATLVNGSFNQSFSALNRNSDGQVRILGFQVPLQGSYGPATFSFNPGLNGATGVLQTNRSVTGGSSTDVAQVSLDLAQVVGQALHVRTGGSISLYGGTVNYTLISASATLDTYFNQNFTTSSA